MDDELRNPIKWDRPCYKCGSHYCDLSCSEPTKNDNAAPQEKGMRDILRDTVRSIIAAHSDGDLDVPLAIADLRAALTKNANAAPDTWTSVKDAMPKSGVIVLAYYINSHNHSRRIRAKWTAAKTEEANAEFYYWGEYDEETDTYWTPEGWYECIDNWDEFSSIMVSEGEVTHWMPLPPAPQDQAMKEQKP